MVFIAFLAQVCLRGISSKFKLSFIDTATRVLPKMNRHVVNKITVNQ